MFICIEETLLSQELKGNVLTHFPRQDRMIKTLVAECHLHPRINAIAESSRTPAIFFSSQ